MDSTPTFPERFFQRIDEADDRLFYANPRLVVHVDDRAVAAMGRYFAEMLPQGGVMLDLMSSWRSHFQEDARPCRLIGLGLNEVEMRHNPQLDEYVVHDLNADPRMPFEDATFDAAVVTVSIQYLTRPVEVFADVFRILKAGAVFHVIYSNRMFPTKAVAIWRALDDRRRGDLVRAYFGASAGWEDVSWKNVSLPAQVYSDPVYAVSGRRPRPVQ